MCRDYFSLVSVRALGYVTGIREDSYAHSRPYHHYDDDGVEGACEVVDSKQPRVLPAPVTMIEYQPVDTVDSLLGRRRGNQNDVEVVCLTKRKQERKGRW
jgi:hypothetical protein